MSDQKQEAKYTVAISDNVNDFDTDDSYRSPQFFHIYSNDELEKFVHQMAITYKKHVMIYQGKF